MSMAIRLVFEERGGRRKRQVVMGMSDMRVVGREPARNTETRRQIDRSWATMDDTAYHTHFATHLRELFLDFGVVAATVVRFKGHVTLHQGHADDGGQIGGIELDDEHQVAAVGSVSTRGEIIENERQGVEPQQQDDRCQNN